MPEILFQLIKTNVTELRYNARNFNHSLVVLHIHFHRSTGSNLNRKQFNGNKAADICAHCARMNSSHLGVLISVKRASTTGCTKTKALINSENVCARIDNGIENVINKCLVKTNVCKMFGDTNSNICSRVFEEIV